MRTLLRRAIARLRGLSGTRSVPEADLDDELADFLARSVNRKLAEGLSPDEARRLARAELGSRAAIHDAVRDVGGGGAVFSTMWQDVRYGARLMRRSPGFTLVAVAVLALGIGVNTALFSIVNALFYAPLQVRAPGELAYIYKLTIYDRVNPIGAKQLNGLATLGAGIVDFTRHGWRSMNLTVDGDTQPAMIESVDGNYFSLLGVKMAAGRPLGPPDDNPAATEFPAVISHTYWKQRFGADLAALGKTIRLSSTSGATVYTIVGVTSAGFRGISDPWSPTQVWIAAPQEEQRSVGGYLIARLKPGTTLDGFRSFIETATETLKEAARQDPFFPGSIKARMAPQDIETMRFAVFPASEVRTPRDPNAKLIPANMLAGLTIVVALVLVIATANVAGLVLARGVSRTSEVAIRRALGAVGGRLTRQLLTETVLLSIAGGVLGLAVASAFLGVFRVTSPSTFGLEVPLEWRVLGFAFGVCLATGIILGLAPAVQAARVSVFDALGNGQIWTRGARTRLRRWVVIPQVALSLLLLVVAGVHVRTLMRIDLTNLGYATEGAFVFRVGRLDALRPQAVLIPSAEERKRVFARDEARAAIFARSLFSSLDAVAEVEQAALTTGLPFGGYQLGWRPAGARESPAQVPAAETWVGDGYFDAMRIRRRAGRTFDQRDGATTRRVAVISQTLARALWPAGNAVGHEIAWIPPPGVLNQPQWLEVVGVVDDVYPVPGRGGELAVLYIPTSQASIAPFRALSRDMLVVRARDSSPATVASIKRAILAADPFAEVSSARTSEQIVGELLYPQRVAATVLTVAGGVGLILAAIGLYGLIAYSVAQRQREIGIRATLGAAPGDLVRLVLRDGARVVAVAGLAGLAIAVLAVRLTAGLLPGLPLVDYFSFIAVPAFLAAVILAAAWFPARRAARVDPIEVLRSS